MQRREWHTGRPKVGVVNRGAEGGMEISFVINKAATVHHSFRLLKPEGLNNTVEFTFHPCKILDSEKGLLEILFHNVRHWLSDK